MSASIYIVAETPELSLAAQQLADKLHLPYSANTTLPSDYLLVLTPHGLKLTQSQQKKRSTPVYIDFLNVQLNYRIQHSNKHNERLARAIGLKKTAGLSIIDATAGFGEDAFLLVHFGCQVLMLERSPIIAVLLQDGLERAKVALPELALNLQHANSINYLQQLQPEYYPDVIYLDPMYPERNKSALPKQHMLWLRDIVGHDPDATKLLPLALLKARKRVVVKRPRLAETINEQKPSLVMTGSSCRFDIYLI